jgi:hypothetical protein
MAAKELFECIDSTVFMLYKAHEHLDKEFVLSRIEMALANLLRWQKDTAPSHKVKHMLKAIEYHRFLVQLKAKYVPAKRGQECHKQDA